MTEFGSHAPDGTCEDLLALVARSHARRMGGGLPPRPRWAGMSAGPVLEGAGLAVRAMVELLPSRWASGLHDLVLRGLTPDCRIPFRPDDPSLEGARELCLRLERDAGTRPALLIMMSHPPVEPPWLNLNMEMTRHAFLGAAVARGGPCRPRMVVAVDSYALDMLDWPRESLYAGFMGSYHLGFDRLARKRGPAGRWLSRPRDWTRLPWRLARLLSGGGEAGIVPAGGVPSTARAVYTARERLVELRRERPGGAAPADILLRLAERDPDFSGFLESGLVGRNLRRNAWRMMEAWIAAYLTGEWGAGPSLAEERALDPGLRARLRACAEALGRLEAFEARAADLEAELARETPYRERLFRFLSRRVAGRGRPLVLLPLSHRGGGEAGPPRMGLRWGPPAALVGCAGDRLELLDAAGRREASSVARFAREFVSANFS